MTGTTRSSAVLGAEGCDVMQTQALGPYRPTRAEA